MLTEEPIVEGRGRAFFRCLEESLERSMRVRAACASPYITLAYAQSLDGSIAARRGQTLRLSNTLSLAMTHHLRAWHDAILVGINTVLADDPQLTVRFAEGNNPRPVVIDGGLRTPPNARLFASPTARPIVATSQTACPGREAHLQKAGAEVVRVPTDDNGRLDLSSLLTLLVQMNIGSVMVEGGAGVLSSFISERLADQVVVTISPRFVGGLPALHRRRGGRSASLPRIRNVRYQALEGDMIVWGDLTRRPTDAPAAGAPS